MNIDRYRKVSPHKKASDACKDHLSWIKQRQCIVSGMIPVDAHHVQRKAQGLNDFLTIPLSHKLHQELHAIGIDTFETKHGIDFKDALIATLVDCLKEMYEFYEK